MNVSELEKMNQQLLGDIEAISKRNVELTKENERLRMDNAMQYNRLRVLNRASTNYTIQYDQDGKETSFSEFKAQWCKDRGVVL